LAAKIYQLTDKHYSRRVMYVMRFSRWDPFLDHSQALSSEKPKTFAKMFLEFL